MVPILPAKKDLLSTQNQIKKIGKVNFIHSEGMNNGPFREDVSALWDYAPHDISMILTLIGAKPDYVDAVGGYYLHQSIADVTTTHLIFPAGEQAHIFVSWLHPFKEQKLVVIGDEAMAVFDDSQPWSQKLSLYRHRVEWRENRPFPTPTDAENISVEEAEPLFEECRHFVDCVTKGKKPLTDGYEGLKVLRVLDEASQSLRKKANRQRKMVYHDVYIHDTAHVDHDVTIGAGTKIWHFTHVLSRASIGKNCVIGQNVMIGPEVSIGDRCKIQNNVSVYKGVVLEADVFCGPSCVFTNVNTPRAHIERKNEFQITHVGRGVTIGANATIVCGVTLGEYAFIGAGAVITKDVPPHALVVGNPGKQIGWVSHAGELLSDNLICPREKRRYRIASDNRLEEIEN